MKSPFPGMDPYLEDYWREVHHSLITYTRDWLQSVMPPDLRVRVEQRVFVESDAPEVRTVFPGVHVVEHGRRHGPAGAAAGAAEAATAVAEPLLVLCDVEPLTQGYIEIVDGASGNRVVTAIESVSPSNKVPGPGQDLYLQKQRETIEAGVEPRPGRGLSAAAAQAAADRPHSPPPNRRGRDARHPGAGRRGLPQRALRRSGLPRAALAPARTPRSGLGRRVAAREGAAVKAQGR